MGLLDSVVGMLGGQQQGAAAGGELLNVVLSMLANGSAHGGLGGLVEKFQQGGMGDVVASWISTGQNMPINGDQLGQVLGPDVLSQIARQLGVSPGDAAGQLSRVLPQVVDELTPNGSVPEDGLGSMAEILGRFR
jgi:uncharacterized protein YidB (DUF937 family)